jgi:hypothetical protein
VESHTHTYTHTHTRARAHTHTHTHTHHFVIDNVLKRILTVAFSFHFFVFPNTSVIIIGHCILNSYFFKANVVTVFLLFGSFYVTSIIWYSVKWFVLSYSFGMSVNKFLSVLEKGFFLQTVYIVQCYAFYSN